MTQVFLSYARSDIKQVDRVCDELSKLDIVTWMDRGSIRGGDHWRSLIVDAIDKSQVLIFFISRSSMKSDNCRRELELATEKGKRIVPVIIESTNISPEFEYHLAGLHNIDLLKNFKIGFQDLLKAVEIADSSQISIEVKLNKKTSDNKKGMDITIGLVLGFLPMAVMVIMEFVSFDRFASRSEIIPGIITIIVGVVLGLNMRISKRPKIGALIGMLIGGIYGAVRGALISGLGEAVGEAIIAGIIGALVGGVITSFAVRFRNI